MGLRPLRPGALCPIAFLITAVAIAFHEALGPAKGLLFRDHHLVFRSRWWAVRESFLSGDLPALTQGGHGKLPLDHLLNGTYTPGTLLLLSGPFEVTYDLFVIAHFVLLAAGVFFLARALGAGKNAAVLSGGVAALSGPVFSLENLVVALIGLAWVPWILLGAHRLLREPTGRNAAWTGIALGFHLQAVIPAVALLDLLAGAALVLHVRSRPSPRLFMAALLAGLLGFGLAAIELFPALEALHGTARGRGFTYEAMSGWALSPGTFLELFVPAFWAPPALPFVNPAAITGNAVDPPYFTTLYFGTAIPLALAGALHRRGRWAALVLLFFLLVAMGRHTPLHALVVKLPGLSLERFAIKYMLVVTAAVACLAPFGLSMIRDRQRMLTWICGLYALLLAALFVALLSVPWDPVLSELLEPGAERWRLKDELPAIVELARKAALYRVGWALLASGALLAALLLGGANKERLCAIAVVADLAIAATFAVSGVDLAGVRPPETALGRIAADRTAQYWSEPTTEIPPLRTKLPEDASTHLEALLFARARRVDLPLMPGRRFEDLELDGQSHPFHAAIARLAANSLSPPGRERLLARVGVKTVLTWRDDVEAPEVARWAGRDVAIVRMHALENANDYVSAYHRWIRFDPASWSEEALTRFLTDEQNRDVGVVLGDVEPPADDCPASRPRLRVAPGAHERTVSVEVDAECDALVVLQEIAVRGWTITVDGEPVDPLEVDAGYLGVRVGAGRHLVRFEYESLVRGWAPLSLASLVVLLLLLLAARRR